ncbi:DUF411 domain-containing protein [Rhodovulum sp. P5]|uniref:DUF411 domain-containing protein n=1 Tax=Rhodovulum sp. P5 TaxID=1564506 RepID=UPI0009DAA703|nr:DUF411 domain-containing protein [Rhodovulum sp. P5]
MTGPALARRGFLLSAAAGLVVAAPALAAAGPRIHVVTDPGCGCCSAWMRILDADGFRVTKEAAAGVALIRYKLDKGVPHSMVSCHTAMVAGYVVEGHVPPADIWRLLADRPDAVGLAVPGMPYGSPGMGPESRREAYDVFLLRRDGSTEVFASYDAA